MYSCGSRQQLLTNINTSLVASGWTSQNVFAFTELIWTGQPSNGQTLIVAGQTYTFRNVIGVANDVLIDTTASDTATNFFNAVNAGPGAGTKYDAGTIANAVIDATDLRVTSVTEGRMRLQSKINTTPFGNQDAYTFGGVISNYQYSWTSNKLAGYIWTCPKTPTAQQQVRVYGIDAGETPSFGALQSARFYVMDENELYRFQQFTSGSQPNTVTLGFRGAFSNPGPVNWRVISNRYSFFAFIDGGAAPNGTGGAVAAGVPFIYSFLAPRFITNATNTNPIVITEDAPHGYSTSNNVFIRGVEGNTAANGAHTITVLSPTTYSIPVAGNGTYITGGVSCLATDDKVGMYFWGAGDENSARMFPMTGFGAEETLIVQCYNGNGFQQNNVNNVGCMSILTMAPSRIQDGGSIMQFASGSRVITEPHMVISGVGAAKARWGSQMYDTMVTLDTQPQGTTATVDGRNWYCLGLQSGSTAKARGSIWVVVP